MARFAKQVAAAFIFVSLAIGLVGTDAAMPPGASWMSGSTVMLVASGVTAPLVDDLYGAFAIGPVTA